MATYQELMQAFKDQGISPDWTYQQRTQQYGSEGNSALDYGVDKIAPTITLGGVNYSYDPDKQTFSSGGEETKDPNTGWGRTYDLTTPEGTTQQRVRSKTDFEKLKPLLIAASVVGGAGLAGMGGLGGLFGGGAAGGAGSAAGGLGAAELAALGELGINTGVAGLPAGAMVLPSGGVISATGELLGTLPANFGSVTAGVGGSSGLSSLGSAASKLLGGDSKGSGNLLPAGLAGLAAALASKQDERHQLAPAGFQGTIDPNRLAYNHDTGEYTIRATGEKYAAGGGISGLRPNEYKAGGRYLKGPGDGMSDNIKANIDGRQEARLADGEFVVPADVVSHIGNGSSNAGAKKLHAMMNRIRHARTGNPKQGKQIKAEKYLPA
jgi:hypothetical protein